MFDYENMSESELKEKFDLAFKSEGEGKFGVQVGPYLLRGEVSYDTDCPGDIEWLHSEECLYNLAVFHSHYNIGNVTGGLDYYDFIAELVSEYNPAAAERWVESEQTSVHKAKLWAHLNVWYITVPVFMYEHSGISISTTPFSCSWDSGSVGFGYVSKEKIRTEFQITRITPTRYREAVNGLTAQVEYFDNIIQGNCYQWAVEVDGEGVESCAGYVGWDTQMLADLKHDFFLVWREYELKNSQFKERLDEFLALDVIAFKGNKEMVEREFRTLPLFTRVGCDAPVVGWWHHEYALANADRLACSDNLEEIFSLLLKADFEKEAGQILSVITAAHVKRIMNIIL